MTLDELIESFPADKEFMIGARTGYFFGGTRTDYESRIDYLYRAHKSKTETDYRHALGVKEDARNYIKHKNNGKTVTLSYEFDRERVDEEAYITEIRTKLREIDSLKKFYSRIKDYINMSELAEKSKDELSLPHYREREVKEVNDSLLEPGVALIIIPGTQNGRYWDMDEYRRGVPHA